MICGLTPDLMKFNFDTFKRSLCARILVMSSNHDEYKYDDDDESYFTVCQVKSLICVLPERMLSLDDSNQELEINRICWQKRGDELKNEGMNVEMKGDAKLLWAGRHWTWT